ncbi:MAG: type II secretion system F family protein [Acidimicrobiales bacterium]
MPAPPGPWRPGPTGPVGADPLRSPAIPPTRSTATALLVTVATVVAPLPLVVALIALAAVSAVTARRRAEAARRCSELDALPRALDLCAVVLGAGGSVRDCVEALARHGPPVVTEAASAALERGAAGRRLDQVLRHLQAALGPRFQPLTGALLLGHERGGSLAVLLGRLAVEASSARRRAGEIRARRLPVVLLVPLVVCCLPAVLIGAVVPLAIVALRQLSL